MTLYSLQFILFFILTFIFLYFTDFNKKLILVFASLIFYLYSGISGFIFLILYTLIVWLFGKLLYRFKIRYIYIMIFLVILPLFITKYLTFIFNNFLNINYQINLIIPLGVSFFTFQSISYLVEIYKDQLTYKYSYLEFLIYCSLFSYVTSGPINRTNVLEQIRNINKLKFNYANVVIGFRFILFGLFMKLFISERVALLVNSVYSNVYLHSGLELLIASICFSIQIYTDFCGYSYIAYGLSKAIGIDVIQNFITPYQADSLKDFWARWHISLSTWFRDYIYIPLGGSRCSNLKKFRNLLITFSISGIWHGASLNYFIWGMSHGVASFIEKEVNYFYKMNKYLKKIILLVFINWTWIIFRLNSFREIYYVTIKIVTDTFNRFLELNSISNFIAFMYKFNISIPNIIVLFLALIFFIIFEFINKNGEYALYLDKKSKLYRYSLYIFLISIILIFGITGEPGDFIYAGY